MRWCVKFIVFFIFTINASVAGLFNHQTFTLPNGLCVYLLPNSFTPMVNVSLYYQVGTADDPRHQHGLSHFVEHMLFKGTKRVQKGVFDTLLLQQGALYNAHTTPDYTAYEATIAKDQLELVLFLEADRMQHLNFNKEDVRSEREVVHEERAMRLDNSPFGKLTEVYLRSLYWKHPYGIPAIGYPEHIDAYDYDSVRRHYETYYVPNNAILVVTGNIDFAVLKTLVQKYFGAIKSKDVPKRIRMEEPSHEDTILSLTHYAARSYLTSIATAYKAPCLFSNGKEHVLPLILLDQILTGNELSRWHTMFVEDEKLATTIHFDYQYSSIDPTALEIDMVLVDGVNVERARMRLEQEIQSLIEKGVSDDEILRAKRDLVGHLAFMKDGVHGMIKAFSGIAVGVSPEFLETWDDRLKKVTKEQVNDAIRFVFSKKPLAHLTIYPKSKEDNQKISQDDPMVSISWNERVKSFCVDIYMKLLSVFS